MPKRPCPFEDNLLPQLKVHVCQKQVDNGVCQEERMKNVYGMEVIIQDVQTKYYNKYKNAYSKE